MNIEFVTSFNEAGRIKYGMRFLESWKKYSTFPLVVFLEDSAREDCVASEYISYRYLDPVVLNAQDNVNKYIFTLLQGVVGDDAYNVINSYRYQSAKFSRKVFALSEACSKRGWRIWIDADTVVTRHLDNDFIMDVLEPAKDCICAYLGRKNWNHSECGFVAYNLDKGAQCVIDYFRAMYEEFFFLELNEWHDSYVFDHIRNHYENSGLKFYDISQGLDLGSVKEKGPEVLHIWPHTILGKYFEHYKGALKG